MPRKAIDETGNRYTRLTVVGRDGLSDTGATWLCKCDCGNEIIAAGASLRRGAIKSCGCLKKEISKLAMEEIQMRSCGRQNLRHGDAKSGSEAPEWKIWCGIRDRCFNERSRGYPDYGGRGIRMHQDWVDSYESFLAHVGRRPGKNYSIDRIDNDGHYEPGNVRWGTPKDQARNRRNTVMVEAFGVERTLVEWSEITGVKDSTIRRRLKKGWDPERAVSHPVC